VHRECRQWQHNVALNGSIPLQPAPFLGKFILWRIVVAANPVLRELNANFGAAIRHTEGRHCGGNNEREPMYNSQLRDKVSSEGFHDGE
jgi:hypothetical protein